MLFFAVALPAAGAAANTPRSCYDARFDVDKDGYAAAGSLPVTVASGLICPSGYVNWEGDCDDNHARVHPRAHDKPGNAIDDDCDGTPDELEVVYPDAVYWSTAPNSFVMTVRVPSALRTLQASGQLYQRVSYLSFEHTHKTRRTPTTLVEDSLDNGLFSVRVLDLAPATVYQAQVHFYDASNAELAVSDVYRVMTDPAGGLTSWGRYYVINRALREVYSSDLGEVGYHTPVVDGTRYGASAGEKWCTEFYAWATAPYFKGTAGRTDTDDMRRYFDGYGTWTSSARFSQPGDYLGLDTDGDMKKNHSGMAMIYDADEAKLWTIEGNVNDTVALNLRDVNGSEIVGMGTYLDKMMIPVKYKSIPHYADPLLQWLGSAY
jgi:hypothetical protein